MATELTDEEESGFRSWYGAIAKRYGKNPDPDAETGDGQIDHRKFFRRIVEDSDFAEGISNLMEHSQMNLDTGKAYLHRLEDGSIDGVSTIYTTSEADEHGVETIFPTVWDAKIPEDDTSFTMSEARSRARSSGKKWPTANSPDEANEIAEWAHQLVVGQKPRTPVGERALRIGL